jgi:hypothetical protein
VTGKVLGSRVAAPSPSGLRTRLERAESLVPAERDRRTPTAGRREHMNQRNSEDPAQKKEDAIRSDAPMQGEGNYSAGRRYDKAQQEFVKSGQVDEAARKSEPDSPDEREDMDKAEQEGRRHARK